MAFVAMPARLADRELAFLDFCGSSVGSRMRRSRRIVVDGRHPHWWRSRLPSGRIDLSGAPLCRSSSAASLMPRTVGAVLDRLESSALKDSGNAGCRAILAANDSSTSFASSADTSAGSTLAQTAQRVPAAISPLAHRSWHRARRDHARQRSPLL